MLSMIVATANNGVIGVNNTLPWHLPEDLKRFRALTTGHHIIMGRKTYESLNRLLPDRTTVIVTHNPDYHVEGAIVVHSLEEAIRVTQHDTEAFLIGGAELYRTGLAYIDKLYLTKVDLEVAGDAFLPEIDWSAWQLDEQTAQTSQNGLNFQYLTYRRKG